MGCCSSSNGVDSGSSEGIASLAKQENSTELRTGGGKEKSSINCVKNGSVLTIELLPHVHTLFCERKQRVCTAAGKIQEKEIIKMKGLEAPLFNCVWIRTAVGAPANSAYSVIEGTENQDTYSLDVDDIGCFISFRHVWLVDSAPKVIQAREAIGPVVAGPARLLNICITGSDESNFECNKVEIVKPVDITDEEDEDENLPIIKVGQYAIAQISYVGGRPGGSEFWWMKTMPDGRREQLTQPRSVDVSKKPIDAPNDCPWIIKKVSENITPEDVAILMKSIPRSASTDLSVSDNPIYGLGDEEVDEETIQEEKHIVTLSDPRLYLIKPEDIGCKLKVKCVPIRNDLYRGEVCTSPATSAIVS